MPRRLPAQLRAATRLSTASDRTGANSVRAIQRRRRGNAGGTYAAGANPSLRNPGRRQGKRNQSEKTDQPNRRSRERRRPRSLRVWTSKGGHRASEMGGAGARECRGGGEEGR